MPVNKFKTTFIKNASGLNRNKPDRLEDITFSGVFNVVKCTKIGTGLEWQLDTATPDEEMARRRAMLLVAQREYDTVKVLDRVQFPVKIVEVDFS